MLDGVTVTQNLKRHDASELVYGTETRRPQDELTAAGGAGGGRGGVGKEFRMGMYTLRAYGYEEARRGQGRDG